LAAKFSLQSLVWQHGFELARNLLTLTPNWNIFPMATLQLPLENSLLIPFVMKKTLTSILFVLSSLPCPAEKDSGFTNLFNGKNLSGWQGMGGTTSNWEVKEGVLSCTGKSGSQWIATKEEFSDFDLRLEFKIPVNGNSGVFIRAPRKGAPWVTGMEIQVLDDYGPKWKNLKPAQFTGAIYAVCAPKVRASKKAGEWQSMRIRCQGATCEVWLNEKPIVKADLGKLAEKSPRVGGLKRTSGFIGLQNHSSPVHYRNLVIKRLK